MRYLNLSLVLVLRVLSARVKRRFPMLVDLIDAGLLTEEEWLIFKDIEAKYPGKKNPENSLE